jgi:hypothetical protein
MFVKGMLDRAAKKVYIIPKFRLVSRFLPQGLHP